MKSLFKKMRVAAVSLLAVAALASCGKSQAEKEDAVKDAAVAVDSVLRTWKSPGGGLTAVEASASGANMAVKLGLGDSLVRVDLLDAGLLDFFVAQQLKGASPDVINQTVKALEGTSGQLDLTISDLHGGSKTFTYTPDNIRFLIKAKASDLNPARVKTDLCTLLTPALPVPATYRESKSVELTVDKGFLTYTVTFPTDSRFAGSKQGMLTGIYAQPLKAQYLALGALRDPIVEMMKSLGIDGIKVVYKAANSDKDLTLAFPWRIICE